MGFLDNIWGKGTFEDIFGREKMDAPTSLMKPGQLQAQQQLMSASLPGATSALGQYGQPYPGNLTTGYEQQGLQNLGDYLSSPMPTESSLFQGAQGELEKTFAGGYDPVGSTYYQAYRTAVMRELEDAKDRLASQTSASDQLFGGGRIKETGRLEEGATNNLAVILGQLFESERDRRLQAVPMAQSLMQAGEGATQARIGASQQFGGLEFQREYGDYVRQMQELGIPLEVAMNLATTKDEYYQTGYDPSFWERILQPMSQAGAQAAGAYAGAGG